MDAETAPGQQLAKAPRKRKRRVGNPGFRPTAKQRELVKSLSGVGVPREQIVAVVYNSKGLPISTATLAKYFRRELDQGLVEANAKVGMSLFRQATSGENFAASRYWAACRMGWREQTPEQTPGLPAPGGELSGSSGPVRVYLPAKEAPVQIANSQVDVVENGVAS